MAHSNVKKVCSACGTSAVNHRLILTLGILEDTLGRIGDKLFNFTSKKNWQGVATFVEKMLYALFTLVGIVRFNEDIEKALTGRSKLIWEEAKRRSIKMEQVVILGKHIEFYRAKINGKKFYFSSLPIPSWMPQEGYKWLDDKFILFEKLSSAGIAVPKAKKVLTLSSAINAFNLLRKPVILKPKNGSRGRHTTTNINTENDMRKAFALGREIAVSMVVQEHLKGSVCRATVVNNELVGFFRADLLHVKGDGHKSIKELIMEKNKNRLKEVSEILINEDIENFIERQGYKLDDVLSQGVIVNLSAKTGRMYGGYTEEMLPNVHPKMHDIFRKAGKIVGVPVAGFDLIIEDPTKDPDTQHWGIIECNSLPFIDLHNFALEGPRIDLAKNIWDLWNIKNK